MSRRKRPSGVGSNSRRFAEISTPDGSSLKVPIAKDVGTFLYVRNRGEAKPTEPTAVLLDAASELQEGALIEIEEFGAGAGMGTIVGARVDEVTLRLSIDSTGRFSKFAQLKKIVHLVRVPWISETVLVAGDRE